MDDTSTITGISEPIGFRYVNAQNGHTTVEGILVEVKITPHRDGGDPSVHMRIRPKNISGGDRTTKTYNIDRVIDCFDYNTGEDTGKNINEIISEIFHKNGINLKINLPFRRVYRRKVDFPFPKISQSVYGAIDGWEFTVIYALAEALDYQYVKFTRNGISSYEWSIGNPRLYSFKTGTIIYHATLPICLQIVDATPDTREGTSIARGNVVVQFFTTKKGQERSHQKFADPFEFSQSGFAKGLKDGSIVPKELLHGDIVQNTLLPA